MAISLRLLLGAVTLMVVAAAVVTVVYAFWDAPPIAKEVPKPANSAKVIGLISDTHTHLPLLSRGMPERVLAVFREANVSLIIHAGDLTSLDVIRELEQIAPVVAVHGNVDPPEVRALLPSFVVKEVSGRRIGVVHSIGFLPGGKEEIARQHDLDVLVFGHTHRPFLKVERGRIFINPGSPVSPLPPLLTKRTIGLLIITEESIEPFIVEV